MAVNSSTSSNSARAVRAIVLLCVGMLGANAVLAASSIVELQSFPSSESSTTTGSDGKTRPVRLINLNERTNTWYVLERGEGRAREIYHLENSAPASQRVSLDDSSPGRLVLTGDDGIHRCDPWSLASQGNVVAARKSGKPFAPICGARLHLRNETRGSRTKVETVTEFLRDNVWGGEHFIGLVKSHVLGDQYLEGAEKLAGADDGNAAHADRSPAAAAVEGKRARLAAGSLGIAAAGHSEGYALGQWYPSEQADGVFVSLMQPGKVTRSILESHRDRSRALDSVESKAIVYLVAFDLDRFALRYSLGTEHPRVDWAARVPATSRVRGSEGPDGFGNHRPLVRTGVVPPRDSRRTVAAFTGGFKRRHGGFKYGELARRNRGSHYGFIEHGVVFSRLQPDLATLIVYNDDRVDMKTWTAADDASLENIRYARQNGVAIVEPGATGGEPVPGALVGSWGPGNWSGSTEGKLRALRAGACLQRAGGRQFLIYGYFSSATPSALARVFQAYGCDYAMPLDMNALEHTYAALYSQDGDALDVEHLVTGMEVLDKEHDDRVLPRFLGLPDNRDFFYLVHR